MAQNEVESASFIVIPHAHNVPFVPLPSLLSSSSASHHPDPQRQLRHAQEAGGYPQAYPLVTGGSPSDRLRPKHMSWRPEQREAFRLATAQCDGALRCAAVLDQVPSSHDCHSGSGFSSSQVSSMVCVTGSLKNSRQGLRIQSQLIQLVTLSSSVQHV